MKTWCGINGVYKDVRECKGNHDICECGNRLRSTLERIAAMDKDGVRADDLGRAAKAARAALSAPQEAGKVEAVADERYADDIACLRGAVSHWRKVLGVDNIEAARKRVHELARPVVLEAIFASLYLRPSQQALGEDAKDAARYRMLRESSQQYYVCFRNPDMGYAFTQHEGEELDEAIDAAILAAAGGSEK